MVNTMDRCYIAARLAMGRWKEKTRALWEEEKGGTATVVVEIVMVGMILVLGFVFREAIGNLFKELWDGLVTFGKKPSDPTISSIDNPFE